MEIIIDSALSFDEAIAGTNAPQSVIDSLALVDVEYLSFDGLIHRGQLVVHKDVAQDVRDIFIELLALSFPIEKVLPMSVYDWNDNAAMADNNSSAFNYRNIACTERLSNHSFGRAIDINPLLNPYTQIDGQVVPEGSYYDPERPGTFATGSAAVRTFTSRGWHWLGEREEATDWQHFEKQ